MAATKHRSLATRNVLREGQEKAYRATKQRYPFLIGSIVWVFMLIVQAAALSVRVFFRRKIGERSFSLGLVLLSYFWIRCFFCLLYTSPSPRD